jgi:hypothetical protein
MANTSDGSPRDKKLLTASDIAAMAARGEDFTSYYVRRAVAIKPIHRLSLHVTARMVRRLDKEAKALNLSREAAVNALLRVALSQQSAINARVRKTA